MRKIKADALLRLILVSGIAGGIVEMIWVTFYAFLMQASATGIAREVSLTLIPSASTWPFASALGVVIHLSLALTLGAGFIIVIWLPFIRKFGRTATVLSSMTSLFAVWVVSFHLVLPILNPAFLTLVPPLVTLTSKLLFGLSMGMALDFLDERAKL